MSSPVQPTRDSRSTKDPDLIWLRDEPGARRPGHSRAQIAAAAIEIADSEGFDAVSMRRVAQELGAGTMTLYHYVRNKDELVMLMNDAVMGEVLVPDGELPEDWREAIAVIAHRSHEAFQRHRWTLDRVTDISIGPNGIKHFEQSLQAVAGTGLPVRERLHTISLVDEFVFGYSLRETLDFGGDAGDEQWPRGTLELFERELQDGAYPHIGSLIAEDLKAANMADGTRLAMQIISDPARFERGLSQLLDGIETGMNGTPD
jgi:AcrR family transcriptional regulator